MLSVSDVTTGEGIQIEVAPGIAIDARSSRPEPAESF
jgi:hypothetical protein